MAFKVINTESFLIEPARSHLETNDCEVIENHLAEISQDEFCEAIRGIEGVVSGGELYTPRVFEAADKLKVIARIGAGYDKIDLDAATKHGVWVCNTPGVNRHAVADLALALILNVARGIPTMMNEMKAGKWRAITGMELSTATVGVVGTGWIGREMVKRLVGCGSTVLVYDVVQDAEFAEENGCEYVPLDDLLSRSDIVTLHCALTDESRGMMDARRLALMKPTAYLVNTSRPEVIDKDMLINALKTGVIAGAGIDVHDPHPAAPDDPLVHLDNVIATPWCAGYSHDAVRAMCMGACEEVVRVLHGEAPFWPVNKL